MAACEPLPPLDYESEHALIGTDQADRVCAGTLARVDATIESVDAQLGYRTGGEPLELYVVDAETLFDYCESMPGGCVTQVGLRRVVLIRATLFDHALTHEVVHERVERTPARGSKPLFNEGIAVALGGNYWRPSEERAPPEIVSLLRPRVSEELRDLPYGYYYAGELTAWLLASQGMDALLDFMAKVDQDDSPAEVREAYERHFGASLDDALFAHAREDGDYSPANLRCTGPRLALEPDRRRLELEADLDCDSPRVETAFPVDDRVFVEWTFEIDEQDAGLWGPVRFTGDDAIPERTLLEIVACRIEDPIETTWSRSVNRRARLDPGVYRLRWSGPMDGDAVLDLALTGPCDPELQDCGEGERCTDDARCVPDS